MNGGQLAMDRAISLVRVDSPDPTDLNLWEVRFGGGLQEYRGPNGSPSAVHPSAVYRVRVAEGGPGVASFTGVRRGEQLWCGRVAVEAVRRRIAAPR